MTNNADMCAANCNLIAESNLNKVSMTSGKSTNDLKNVAAHMNVITNDSFKIVCENYTRPFINCLDGCKDSTSKYLLNIAMVGQKYFCVDHYKDIYDNFDCLQRTKNATILQCDQQYCVNMSTSADKLRNNVESFPSGGFANFPSSLGSYCSYISCVSNCSKPIIERECGPQISQVFTKDFVAVTVQSLKNMLTAFDNSGKLYPTECQQISNDPVAQTPVATTPVAQKNNNNANLIKFNPIFAASILFAYFAT